MRPLGLILLLLVFAAAAQAQSLHPFHYTGDRHAERAGQALDIVRPLLPEAAARAEALLGMRLDRERLDLEMRDIPRSRRAKTVRMRVQGADHPLLIVFLEPVLRGDYPDRDLLLRSLTHEMIHATVRQQLDHAVYARLPDWFQEGIPHLLLDQTADKMLTLAAIEHQGPEIFLSGFAGDHSAYPDITGGYFLAELEARLGRAGLLDFVRGTLHTGTVEHGLEAVSLLDAEMSFDERAVALNELWSAAHDRARADFAEQTGGLSADFAGCMRLYRDGGSDRGAGAIACLQDLIAAHPASYAGQAALYWLSKCHFRRSEPLPALEALDRFDACRLHYGLLDNSRYFRIRLYEQLGRGEELRAACDEYLELFPDGQDFAKVREIRRGLGERRNP